MALTDILKEEWNYRLTKLPAFIVELVLYGLINLAETIRADYVNPASNVIKKVLNTAVPQDMNPSFAREQSPFLYDVMQHSGDFLDGYFMSFFIYNALTFVAPRTSEKLRAGIAAGVSSLVVIGVEQGILVRQQPDTLDIPAGVLGSIFYLGTHYFGRKLSRKLLVANELFLSENRITNIEKYL